MYNELFIDIYKGMLPYIKKEDVVVELGCRDDRGVLSSNMFNCKEFICIDSREDRVMLAKRHSKPDTSFLVLDALRDELPVCDVLITTALIHHYPLDNLKSTLQHFAKSTKRNIIISGPNAESQTQLYGDHRYHILPHDIELAVTDINFKIESILRFNAKNGVITIVLKNED